MHVSTAPGVHETAMQVPGSPEIVPSTSQYGNSGFAHEPAEHAFVVFGVVQPAAKTAKRPNKMRMKEA